ncbi:MAG: serine/threonine protein kinase [Candidatus Melainabacteria bacterium]|nr:MAG: serine/threonine protein kinase [Candidatus Melainabacteria bacterium]
MKTEKSVKQENSNLFEPGQTLGGRYQIISALGRGAVGVVYHVSQMFLNKDMALKTIEKRGLTEKTLHQFQKEARTAFAVKHPNVIAVDDFGLLDDGTPFLVMELIRGETLAERLKRKVNLPVNEAVPMFLQICEGLAHAHQMGIVHRDIKPSNIMIVDDLEVGTEGSVKIVDFGIATFSSPEDDDNQSNEICGSPLYISPEQCTGAAVDERADIYSLGCVLFETLTGTPPFIGENALTTLMKHKSATVPTLREASLGRSFSREMEQIVATMLAKSPDNRYQKITDVARDLASVMQGEKVKPKLAASKPKQQTTAPSTPLTLTRNLFFGIILATTLMSSTIAGFAAFQIKHLEMEKPIVEVIRDKASAQFRAEDSALPLDDETIANIQTIPNDQLLLRLQAAKSDGRLGLHYTNLDRQKLQLIAQANWIKFLDLEQCTLDNKSLAVLSQLPGLYYLCTKASNFDDTGAEALKKVKTLTTVSVGGCNVTDKGVESISFNKNIDYLDLDSTKLTNNGLKFVAQLPKLNKLKVRNNPQLTADGLKHLNSCTIQELWLNDNPGIDDEACRTLSKFPFLSLVLLTNTNVTLTGLEALCGNPSLRELTIDRCKRISEKDAVILRRKNPHLKIHSLPEKPRVNLND